MKFVVGSCNLETNKKNKVNISGTPHNPMQRKPLNAPLGGEKIKVKDKGEHSDSVWSLQRICPWRGRISCYFSLTLISHNSTQHVCTHRSKHMHGGAVSVTRSSRPKAGPWLAKNMLIQLNNNQCLCVPGAEEGSVPRSGLWTPPLPDTPFLDSSNTTVVDTISAVYCLCLTRSQQEMARKVLFVWRGWGWPKLSWDQDKGKDGAEPSGEMFCLGRHTGVCGESVSPQKVHSWPAIQSPPICVCATLSSTSTNGRI